MSYRMAGGVFGELQNSFDREDAAYADKYKTDLSTALANRNAYAAAQQEALRQAQLEEAYDFQDLQNRQIQKQRALENAMGARRQLQHEYEFGEKMKAEAAANKLWQENERLRIGEQKAREADRLAQQQQRDYFDLLKDASKGAVPWSALQPVADALPDNLGSEVRAAFAQNELRQAEAQEATKGVAEGWNRELDAIDAQYPENDPSKAFMREQALKNLRSSIPTGWNKVHRKMPFETVFFESDGRYFPRVSQSQEYQFIQPREGAPGQWDVFPNIMRDRAVPQAAPRPETPTPVPQAAPRAAAPRISEEPSFFGQAATALEATSDMPRMNGLMWARTQQQRTGLKSLGDAISSGSRGIPGTSGEPGPAAIPEPDLSEQLRSVRAQIAASPNYRPDLSAERNRLMAELYARNQRDTAGRPPVGLVDNSLDDYKRDYWLDLFAKAAFQGVGTGVQEARDALYEQMPRDRERLDEARRRQFNRWRTSSGLSPVLRHSPPAGPVTPRDIYPFQNPSAPETLFELATLPDLAR